MIFLYVLISLMTVVSLNFVLEHRLYLVGLPINIVDAVTLLTMIVVMLFQGKVVPIDQAKRNYVWPVLTLWGIALTASGLVGLMKGADTYLLLQPMKWYLKMPMGMLCGYYAVRNLKDTRRLIKFMCLLSCILCVLIVLNFSSRGQTYTVTGVYRDLQSRDYYPRLGATIAIFLVYTAAVNPRFIPRAIAVLVLTMSIIAVGAQLWRTAIISLVLSTVMTVIIIPKGYRLRAWRALFSSGKWIIVAMVFGTLMSQTFAGIDIVGIIVERFRSLGAREASAMGRWVGAFSELKVWLSSTVIFGAGYGVVREMWYEEAATGVMGHNAITTTLARSGLMGLLALLYPFFVAFRIARQMLARVDPDMRAVGAMVMAAALYVGIYNPLSGYVEGNALFFGILFGIGAKCYRFRPRPEEAGLEGRGLDWDDSPPPTAAGHAYGPARRW